MFEVLPDAVPSLLARFVIYGALGWCAEIVFTGISSAVFHRDRALTGRTYLWMHPVWGLTCLLLENVQDAMPEQYRIVRALAYLLVIYAAEFGFGWVLKKGLGRCPWDYTGRGLNVMGLIRLDYAPAWFFAALLYEPFRTIVATFASAHTMQQLAQQLIAWR